MFVINQPVVGVSDYFWSGIGWIPSLEDAERYSTRKAAKAVKAAIMEVPARHSRPLTIMEVAA